MIGRPSNRWNALGIHLLISMLIFIALAAIILFVWYPGFLFKTDGGWQGIRLIAGIDLILGPLLTLTVYNPAKKSLTFDLSCIAIVQLAALSYGTYLVYNERPIAVIFAEGQYSTASKTSYDFHSIDSDSINIIQQNTQPVWIYVELPTLLTKETRHEQIRIGAEHFWIQGYQPYIKNLQNLNQFGKNHIDGYPTTKENQLYFPLLSKYYEGYLLIELTTGKPIQTILLNPIDSSKIRF